jgi:hypothetical protein
MITTGATNSMNKAAVSRDSSRNSFRKMSPNPHDWNVQLGLYANPTFRNAVERVRELCARRRIAFTGVAATPDDIKPAVESGAQLILYATDLALMRREAERAAGALAPFRKRRAV